MSPATDRLSSWQIAVLAVVLLASFVLKLRHLDHVVLRPLDEAFHVLVARNGIDDPLTPTLYRPPLLAAPMEDWQRAHVWLHKPPLATWQMAIAMALGGETPLVARLPSAILSGLACVLTFLIGRRLVSTNAGLVAAGVQAFHPVAWMQVHGYVFSDHIDTALVFYVTLGVWLLVRAMQDGRARDVVLAGVVTGLAYLTKSYLALIVPGIALAAWLATRTRWCDPADSRLRGRHVATILGVAILTSLPWTIWAWSRFPALFIYEHNHVLAHLSQDVESWAGPWDRVPFDYWVRMFHVLYVPCLVGLAVATWDAATRRSLPRLALVAWTLGVLVPHVLATTKTPSATMIASPAMFLLLGMLVSDAIARRPLAVGSLLASLAVTAVLYPSRPASSGMGPTSEFAVALRANPWVIGHVAVALGVGVAMAMAARRRNLVSPATLSRVLTALLIVSILPAGWLAWRWTRLAHAVTSINDNTPSLVATGRWIRDHAPANAIVLVDETEKLERLQVMFWADRNAYPLGEIEALEARLAEVRDAGGVAVVVSPRDDLPLPRAHRVEAERRTIYAP